MGEREQSIRKIAQQLAQLRGQVGELATTRDDLTILRVLIRKLDEAYDEALLQAHIAFEDAKKGETNG